MPKHKIVTRSSKNPKQGTIISHLSSSSSTVSTDACYNTVNTDTSNSELTHNNSMAGSTSSDNKDVSNTELKELLLRLESTMTKRMDKLQEDLNFIKQKVMKNEKDIEDLKTSTEHNAADISDIVEEMIPEINKAREDAFDKLENELMRQELHDRKNNLIFHGVDSRMTEPKHELEAKMRGVFQKDFGLTKKQAETVYLVDVHRLPRKPKPLPRDDDQARQQLRNNRPDPVIVRFASIIERDFILEQQRRRPYNRDQRPVMAYTDLPVKMKAERHRLLQKAKSLRSEGMMARVRTRKLEVILEHKANRNSQWKQYKEN